MKYNYNKQFVTADDIKNVVNVLKSERITQGHLVKSFENEIKNYFGSKYALTTSNATSAFTILSQALKWSQKDYIILSPITFVSAANSVLKSGANPVFVDTLSTDQNLDPDLVEKKIRFLKRKRKKVRAVIITDYAGNPADWKKFKKIKIKYNLDLINDNCHALGATYYNSTKYAIKYSDYVVQSYHAVKNITTAEGGSILTNKKSIFDKLKILREHGFLKNDEKNPFRYNIKEAGFNFRLSDLNCALGSSQIKRLNYISQQRDNLARIYDKIFKTNNNIIIPKRFQEKKSAYHLYNIRIKFKNLRITKNRFYKILKNKYKINLQVHYTPTYKFDVFKKFVVNQNSFENCEKYFKETFSLPLYLQLKKNDIIYIANKILKLVKKYSKI